MKRAFYGMYVYVLCFVCYSTYLPTIMRTQSRNQTEIYTRICTQTKYIPIYILNENTCRWYYAGRIWDVYAENTVG